MFPFLFERVGGMCCRNWRVCRLSTYFLTCVHQVRSVSVGTDPWVQQTTSPSLGELPYWRGGAGDR